MPKPRRKPKVDPDLPNPGERQRCRFPAQWGNYSEADRRAMEARGRQLVNGDRINWG